LVWESAVSGAIAGAAGALILYPADTVKSAIQTAEEMRRSSSSSSNSSPSSIPRELPPRAGAVRKRKVGIGTGGGFWKTFGQMYRVHGIKGLYAGCGMTVARAIPSSGIIFVVYDGLNNWFNA
jgi:ornithine carrier protein